MVDGVFGGLKTDPYDGLSRRHVRFPVSLFKQHELLSVPREDVHRVLSSSGTTGQSVSRVFLDRDTAALQAKALVRIMQHFIGRERLPMVILDNEDVVRDRTAFSARGAGILGLMQFGWKPIYALRSDMTFDHQRVDAYSSGKLGEAGPVFENCTFMRCWLPRHPSNCGARAGSSRPVRES